MAAPSTFDLEYVRGTTQAFRIKFTRAGVAVPFADARLTAATNGGTFLFRLSIEEGSGEKTDDGEVTFHFTAAQTRLLKQTGSDGQPKNKYEVELRNGTDESVYLTGSISGLGGINDDESVS